MKSIKRRTTRREPASSRRHDAYDAIVDALGATRGDPEKLFATVLDVFNDIEESILRKVATVDRFATELLSPADREAMKSAHEGNRAAALAWEYIKRGPAGVTVALEEIAEED